MTVKSVTTLCFKPFRLEEALDAAAASGFAQVEICAIKGWLEHVDPDDISPATLRRVRRALADSGLSAISVAGHGDLVSPEGLERHLRLLEFVREIGASFLNSFPAVPEGSVQWAELVVSARRLGDRAAELDVHFCLENDGTEVGTGEAVSRLVREIGHERVGVLYDAANAVFSGGVDPAADLSKALPWARELHIKDQRGGQGAYDFPPLGEGDLDWPELFRSLDAFGYAGPRCLEIEFDGRNWPTLEECTRAVVRSREQWDRLELAS